MRALKDIFAVLVAVILVACTVITLAQKPATAEPKISPEAKTRLLSAYKSALIAQTNAQIAQQRLQLSIKAYQDLAEKESADAKLPKGSSFSVNADTDEVTIVLPPEPKKAEENK